MNKILLIAIIFLISSCVSSRKYKDLTSQYTASQSTVQSLETQNQALKVRGTELQARVDQLTRDLEQATHRLEEAERSLKSSQEAHQRLSQFNASLEEQLKSLKQGSSDEIARLMEKLQQTQNDLQKREEVLATAQAELEQRSQRMNELEEALRQKEAAVKEIREKVMNALVGFNNKGLTIHEQNGKVYVSLDEQLLFKTGQWEVDPKGQQALSNLAGVLAQNTDINVLVEGHTDDVPMRGTGMVKDNWDLSVMRATAVTKILLRNKAIDPQRVTSAGRAEFFPIDTQKTPEARQKNRRTEIILTPRLDEIFRLLENN